MDSDKRKRVRELLPDLVKQVDPIEILPYLPCLSDTSRERIINCQKQTSNLEAMMTLHEHIGRRDKAFDQLVHGLRELDFNHLADRLNKDTDSHREKTDKKFVKQTHMKLHQRRMPKAEHSTYIRDLNARAFDILERLDYCGTQRWKQLAGHLGFSISDCNKIENDAAVTKEHPTVVLVKQCNDLTLGELLHILMYDMERMDVVESLEKLTGYKLPVIEDITSAKAYTKDERSVPNGNALNVKEPLPLRCEIIYDRQGQLDDERDGKSFVQKGDTHLGRLVDMRDAAVKPLVITTAECSDKIKDVNPPQYHQTINYDTTNLPKPVIKLIKQQSSEKEETSVLSQMQYKSKISILEEHVTTLGSRMKNDDDSSLSMNPLHAREEHEGTDYTGSGVNLIQTPLEGTDCARSGVNLIEIPVEGAAPLLVKQVRFHQQECEQPGPYVPITGGSPAILHSPTTVVLDNRLQPKGTLHDTNLVVPVPNLSNSMFISVGEAQSVHHHRDTTQSVSDYTSDAESMLSSNEEKAEIQRKAYKSLPNAIGEDSPADINSIGKGEIRHDCDQEYSGTSYAHSVSDTVSYQIASVLTLEDNNKSNSQSDLQLNSEHFTSRLNTKDVGQFDSNQANSVSETDSYQITSVLTMDDVKTSNSPSGLQLGSELFTRRMSANILLGDRDTNTAFSIQPSAEFKDVHGTVGEHDNTLTELQSDTGLNTIPGLDEVRELSRIGNGGNNCTGLQVQISDDPLGNGVPLVTRGIIEQIDNNGNVSDSPLKLGASDITQQNSVGDYESNGADDNVSFPWMRSLLFVGTAVAASLAYKGLKG